MTNQCPHCPSTYGRERDLKRHLTMKHNGTPAVVEPQRQELPTRIADIRVGHSIVWDGEPHKVEQRRGPRMLVLEGGRHLIFDSERTPVRKVLT